MLSRLKTHAVKCQKYDDNEQYLWNDNSNDVDNVYQHHNNENDKDERKIIPTGDNENIDCLSKKLSTTNSSSIENKNEQRDEDRGNSNIHALSPSTEATATTSNNANTPKNLNKCSSSPKRLTDNNKNGVQTYFDFDAYHTTSNDKIMNHNIRNEEKTEQTSSATTTAVVPNNEENVGNSNIIDNNDLGSSEHCIEVSMTKLNDNENSTDCDVGADNILYDDYFYNEPSNGDGNNDDDIGNVCGSVVIKKTKSRKKRIKSKLKKLNVFGKKYKDTKKQRKILAASTSSDKSNESPMIVEGIDGLKSVVEDNDEEQYESESEDEGDYRQQQDDEIMWSSVTGTLESSSNPTGRDEAASSVIALDDERMPTSSELGNKANLSPGRRQQKSQSLKITRKKKKLGSNGKPILATSLSKPNSILPTLDEASYHSGYDSLNHSTTSGRGMNSIIDLDDELESIDDEEEDDDEERSLSSISTSNLINRYDDTSLISRTHDSEDYNTKDEYTLEELIRQKKTLLYGDSDNENDKNIENEVNAEDDASVNIEHTKKLLSGDEDNQVLEREDDQYRVHSNGRLSPDEVMKRLSLHAENDDTDDRGEDYSMETPSQEEQTKLRKQEHYDKIQELDDLIKQQKQKEQGMLLPRHEKKVDSSSPSGKNDNELQYRNPKTSADKKDTNQLYNKQLLLKNKKQKDELDEIASNHALRGKEKDAVQNYHRILKISRNDIMYVKDLIVKFKKNEKKSKETVRKYKTLRNIWKTLLLREAQVWINMSVLQERIDSYGDAINSSREARNIYQRLHKYLVTNASGKVSNTSATDEPASPGESDIFNPYGKSPSSTSSEVDEEGEQDHDSFVIEDDESIVNCSLSTIDEYINQVNSMLTQLKKSRETLGKRKELHDRVTFLRQEICIALVSNSTEPYVYGLFKKTFGLLHEILTIEKDCLGKSNPKIANTITFLGTIYLKSSQIQKALKQFHKSINILKLSLGVYHPRYGLACKQLAKLYESLYNGSNANSDNDEDSSDYIDSAIHLYKDAIVSFREAYGLHHALVGSTTLTLANMYIYQKQNYDLAIETLSDALVSYESTSSDDNRRVQQKNRRHDIANSANASYSLNIATLNPETANIWRSLGYVYSVRKQYDSSIMAYQSSLNIQRNNQNLIKLKNERIEQMKNGELHNFTDIEDNDDDGVSNDEYSSIEVSADEQSQSYEDKFADKRNMDTESMTFINEEKIADTLKELGVVLMKVGRYEDALGVYEEVLNIRQNAVVATNKRHNATTKSNGNSKDDDNSSNKGLHSDVLTAQEHVADTMQRMAGCQESLKNLDAAMSLYVASLMLRRQNYILSLGNQELDKMADSSKIVDSIECGHSLMGIGSVHLLNGDASDAIEVFKEAYDIYVANGLDRIKSPEIQKVQIRIDEANRMNTLTITSSISSDTYDTTTSYTTSGDTNDDGDEEGDNDTTCSTISIESTASTSLRQKHRRRQHKGEKGEVDKTPQKSNKSKDVTKTKKKKTKKKTSKTDRTLVMDYDAHRLMENGDYEGAIRILTQVLVIRRQRLTRRQDKIQEQRQQEQKQKELDRNLALVDDRNDIITTNSSPTNYDSGSPYFMKEKDDIARTLSCFGVVLKNKGDYKQAMIMFHQSIRMYRSNGCRDSEDCIIDIKDEIYDIEKQQHSNNHSVSNSSSISNGSRIMTSGLTTLANTTRCSGSSLESGENSFTQDSDRYISQGCSAQMYL